MSKFNYNNKIITAIKRYNANTAIYPANLTIANANVFSIDFANVSTILKNFINNLDEVNLNSLGLDSGNLNLTFSSNVSSNYFIGNIAVIANSNLNTYTYTTLFCYTFDFSQISSTINLKGYVS